MIEVMQNLKDPSLGDIFNSKGTIHFEVITNAFNPELISLLNVLKLIGIFEYQREDSKIDQVGSVNACIRLCQDRFDPEVHRSQSSMLPARTLPIIFTPYHPSASKLFCPFIETGIHPLKEVFRNGWDIGAERENLRPSR
jgi:hypothetical protein